MLICKKILLIFVMALSNFTLPFGVFSQTSQSWSATISPIENVHPLATNTNSLLYAPSDHQQPVDVTMSPIISGYYKNNPYGTPELHQRPQNVYNSYNNNNHRKNTNTYLPPIPPPGAINLRNQRNQVSQSNTHPQHEPEKKNVINKTSLNSNAEGSYTSFPSFGQVKRRYQQENTQISSPFSSHRRKGAEDIVPPTYQQTQNTIISPAAILNSNHESQHTPTNSQNLPPSYGFSDVEGGDTTHKDNTLSYPDRPSGFTRVQAGQGSRTEIHAVLDYDAEDEDNYDENDQPEPIYKDGKHNLPTVTPIQGPIFIKNGTVPVVPLFSYPIINNGSFVQIPIWWTALSVALGLDVRGDVIKGVPCIKRFHQLFCPTAGNSYPIERIERFIDDNKALMRRMYGDFEMTFEGGGSQQPKKRKRRFIDDPDIFIPPEVFASESDDNYSHMQEPGETYFGKLRNKRQTSNQNRNSKIRGQNSGLGGLGNPDGTGTSSSGRLDSCESKIEIVTPYWASNSAGKIRAIVNTQHFEQAIHQEICSKSQTTRCERDCGCEQKYKWHRLLAYDPDNDCKGIFMDWFLFPSCCVCRCNP